MMQKKAKITTYRIAGTLEGELTKAGKLDGGYTTAGKL